MIRVRRRPLLPFFVALAGLPLVAIAFDFFTGARLLSRIGEVVYVSDVDAFELRDAFLASLFAFAGSGMVLWGLRDLVLPQTVLKADETGVRVAVRSPFAKATFVPWSDIEEFAAARRSVDGHETDALAITVTTQGELPDNPWSARWVGGRHTLVMDVRRWDTELSKLVDRLTIMRREAIVAPPPPIPDDTVVDT